MADNQTCPVHSLLEDIQDGSLFVYPVKKRLRDLDPRQCPTAAAVHVDCNLIGAAHVFDFSGWPSNTVFLSDELWDTGESLLNSGMAKLPFATTIFSRRLREGTGQLYDVAVVAGTYADPENPEEPVIGARSYQRMIGKTRWRFNGHTLLFNRHGEMAQQWLDSTEGLVEDFAVTALEAGTAGLFCSALAALSSKGPEIRVQPAPKHLNKQRAKKGKPPLFEYRIVDIPRWAREKAEAGGGTHASPRLHWRRGHERRLGNGRKTFVHAHLVGVAENGFVDKDYAVAPDPA